MGPAQGLTAITPDSGYNARILLPAIAVGYDWCYDRLTPDQRTTFRAFMGDLDAAEHVVEVGCLPEGDLRYLRDMVSRRRGTPLTDSQEVVK